MCIFTHHLVKRRHQNTQRRKHRPQQVEPHVKVRVQYHPQCDGNLEKFKTTKSHLTAHHNDFKLQLLCSDYFPYQSQFDLGGEALLVVGGLDEDDDGRGHGFGQLVRSYRVVLQGEVGEGHEPTEAQSQPHDPANGEAFWGENVHFLADEESQPGDHEVDEGQGHVGEAVVNVDPLVDEDDADGGEQVDQQAGGDAPIG